MARIVIDGVSHFFRLEGENGKPVLVLAHPVGADHGIWDQVVPALSHHFQILRYDLRGHGATDATPAEISVAMLGNDVIALTEQLDIAKFTFCGVSLGALAGLSVAVHAPAKLEALVMANVSPKLPLSTEQWNARITQVRNEGMKALVAGMIDRMFSPNYRKRNDPFFHTMVNTFLATLPQGYASGLAALRDTDLRDVLGTISTKTLVIGSHDDLAVPASDITLLANAIPGADHKVVSGGHLSPVEVPEEFAAATLSFLKR